MYMPRRSVGTGGASKNTDKSGVSGQRNERKERKNRKLQPIGTELYSFLLNSSF